MSRTTRLDGSRTRRDGCIGRLPASLHRRSCGGHLTLDCLRCPRVMWWAPDPGLLALPACPVTAWLKLTS